MQSCLSRRIRAVANRISPARRANTDVIVVRAEGDIFILQNGVAAFPNSDDVLGSHRLRLEADTKARLLVWTQLEGLNQIT